MDELDKPIPAEEFIRHGPSVAEMRWDSVSPSYLTPNERFFVRSQGPSPLISSATWRLEVSGPAVGRQLTISYDELCRLPRVTITCALECAGNGRRFFERSHDGLPPGTPWGLGGIGVAEWTGVRMSELLERAHVRPYARDVMPVGLDNAAVRRPLPVEKAMEDDTILAFHMNGEPLPRDHGHPARLIVPGWVGIASVKWVGRIVVSGRRLSSPWSTETYVWKGPASEGPPVPLTDVGVKSALELPWPARVKAGLVTIRGRSWSGRGSILSVECSDNGGRTWQPARMVPPNLSRAWVRWEFDWQARPGDCELMVRATDDLGNVQPELPPWNELGYLNGAIVAHPVRVE